MYLSATHCLALGETEGPAHTDITRKCETKSNPSSAYRKLWNNLNIIGVHLKHNRTKFWASRNSIICKNISIVATSLHLREFHDQYGTLGESHYTFGVKWWISHTFQACWVTWQTQLTYFALYLLGWHPQWLLPMHPAQLETRSGCVYLILMAFEHKWQSPNHLILHPVVNPPTQKLYSN